MVRIMAPRKERETRVRYVVEPMTMSDIPRVTEIERLAYATPWPTSAYRRELQENTWARYIVARDALLRESTPDSTPAAEHPKRGFPLSLLPNRAPAPPQLPRSDLASIIGFAGLWLMVDEAHVTTIASHPDYRGRGVGELMLSGLIDISYEIGARMVTLEVRVSNFVAQNLYRKYGFREAGIRKRYYSDNHEDALIMWTPEIRMPEYYDQFMRLKAVLATRLADDQRASETQPEARAVGEDGSERN
jgi:ribosomal-protein-alanine N-acetyltransferase